MTPENPPPALQALRAGLPEEKIFVSHGETTHQLGADCSVCDKVALSWPPTARLIARAREEERSKLFELYNCIGPTDELHRCSYGHCQNCGRCDDVSEFTERSG